MSGSNTPLISGPPGSVVAVPPGSTAAAVQPTILVETGVDRLVAWALLAVVGCACAFLLLAAVAANLAAPGQQLNQAGPLASSAINTGLQRYLLALIARDTASVGWYITNLVRGAEVLSTITAALMVFLIIRARQGDALMTLLGLIVIAALIVPTNELIRLTESARGGNDQGRDMPRSSAVTIASPDASVLIAQRVIQDLQFEQLIVTDSREGQPDRLVAPDARRFRDSLGVALYRVEIGNIANTIRQRNLDRLLLELTVPESRTNLLLSPSTSRQAREDIALLRDLGVVSHLYGSMAQLEISELGLRVLHRLYPENPGVRSLAEARRTQLFSPAEGVAQQAAVVRAAAPVTPPTGLTRSAVELRIPSGLPWSQRLEITQGLGHGVRLTVERDTELVIEARATDGRFDPMIRLWDLVDGQPRTLVAEVDDWGNSVDARMLRPFPAGTYLVQFVGFGSTSGGARAAIREPSQRDRETRSWLTPRDTLLSGAENIDLAALPFSAQLTIPADGMVSRRVQVREPMTLRFRTISTGTEADPILELWRLEGNEGTEEASDDDSGGGRDSLIERAVVPGEYVVRLRDLNGRASAVTMGVERVTSPPAAPAPAPARQP
ncbi:hypothetical protein [Roseococcus sp. YIM B11640]|uniref:hypothetical protein n=1 Tax=Roseococcus sp. YIM B11640 TaxID=3133973 RepID=UPI003C7C7001